MCSCWVVMTMLLPGDDECVVPGGDERVVASALAFRI